MVDVFWVKKVTKSRSTCLFLFLAMVRIKRRNTACIFDPCYVQHADKMLSMADVVAVSVRENSLALRKHLIEYLSHRLHAPLVFDWRRASERLLHVLRRCQLLVLRLLLVLLRLLILRLLILRLLLLLIRLQILLLILRLLILLHLLLLLLLLSGRRKRADSADEASRRLRWLTLATAAAGALRFAGSASHVVVLVV